MVLSAFKSFLGLAIIFFQFVCNRVCFCKRCCCIVRIPYSFNSAGFGRTFRGVAHPC